MESLLLDDDLKEEFGTEWDAELFDNPVNPDIIHEEQSEEQSLPKPEHLNILSKCFGHKKFRPLQWKIINSIITERRDNCAIMTTGYGKSLCYQYPAVYMKGLTIVISPLISLMEDQVLAMQVSNIPACLLGTANKKSGQTINEIFENQYRLVYVTPEFCTGDYGTELLQRMYAQLSVSLIAVDEAHCVSSWGHDFRFQYRHLGVLKDIMPNVPILAVTATATQKVRDDIVKTLKLQNPQITCSGFDRPNLYFSVNLKSPSILNDLRKVMKHQGGQWKFPGSTIIYCLTRKQTEEISAVLSATGIQCLPYHAGLSLIVRKDTHEQFLKDRVDVIVATIAFGMGIDKPDVRNIIHYGSSNSIEGYYQEVGRAGRDGLPATCTTFYCNRDFETLSYMNDSNMSTSAAKSNKNKMIDNMKDYLSSTKCRRRYILSYFKDEKVKPNDRCCDNCSKSETDTSCYEGLDSDGKYDFTEDAELFLKAVSMLNGKFGVTMYVLFLRGSRMNKLTNYLKYPLHGRGKDKSEAWWKGIAILLEKEKYLQKVRNKYTPISYSVATICVSEKGEKFLKNKIKLLLHPIPELLQCLKSKPNTWLSTVSQPCPSTSTSAAGDKPRQPNMKLYQLLLNKRYELATLHDCMPYTIASNSALMEIDKHKPTTLEQLKKCQLEGFTEAKIAKFGGEFVKTVRLIVGLGNEGQAERMSIQDALRQYPLTTTAQNSSAHTSYSMFKAGLTVHEISQKRGVSPNTIMSHLIDIMKLGCPIKLAELDVTVEVKDAIEEAVKKVDTGLSLLTPIKNACPPDITYNQIKAVVTYLQIRQHLKNQNVSYIEFDDIDSVLDVHFQPTPKPEASTSDTNIDSSQLRPTQKLKELIRVLEQDVKASEAEPNGNGEDSNSNFSDGFDDIIFAACDELETSLNETKGEVSDNAKLGNASEGTKAEKPAGFDFSILDSPPRSTVSQEKRKIEETAPKPSNKSKKMNLPPWLMHQRIA